MEELDIGHTQVLHSCTQPHTTTSLKIRQHFSVSCLDHTMLILLNSACKTGDSRCDWKTELEITVHFMKETLYRSDTSHVFSVFITLFSAPCNNTAVVMMLGAPLQNSYEQKHLASHIHFVEMELMFD